MNNIDKYKIKDLPRSEENETWCTYLQKINAIYYVDGIEWYKRIEDNSVDIVFSFAVLEHVRKKIFIKTLQEIFQFMRSGGWHTIQLILQIIWGKKQSQIWQQCMGK